MDKAWENEWGRILGSWECLSREGVRFSDSIHRSRGFQSYRIGVQTQLQYNFMPSILLRVWHQHNFLCWGVCDTLDDFVLTLGILRAAIEDPRKAPLLAGYPEWGPLMGALLNG